MGKRGRRTGHKPPNDAGRFPLTAAQARLPIHHRQPRTFMLDGVEVMARTRSEAVGLRRKRRTEAA